MSQMQIKLKPSQIDTSRWYLRLLHRRSCLPASLRALNAALIRTLDARCDLRSLRAARYSLYVDTLGGDLRRTIILLSGIESHNESVLSPLPRPRSNILFALEGQDQPVRGDCVYRCQFNSPPEQTQISVDGFDWHVVVDIEVYLNSLGRHLTVIHLRWKRDGSSLWKLGRARPSNSSESVQAQCGDYLLTRIAIMIPRDGLSTEKGKMYQEVAEVTYEDGTQPLFLCQKDIENRWIISGPEELLVAATRELEAASIVP